MYFFLQRKTLSFSIQKKKKVNKRTKKYNYVKRENVAIATDQCECKQSIKLSHF